MFLPVAPLSFFFSTDPSASRMIQYETIMKLFSQPLNAIEEMNRYNQNQNAFRKAYCNNTCHVLSGWLLGRWPDPVGRCVSTDMFAFDDDDVLPTV